MTTTKMSKAFCLLLITLISVHGVAHAETVQENDLRMSSHSKGTISPFIKLSSGYEDVVHLGVGGSLLLMGPLGYANIGIDFSYYEVGGESDVDFKGKGQFVVGASSLTKEGRVTIGLSVGAYYHTTVGYSFAQIPFGIGILVAWYDSRRDQESGLKETYPKAFILVVPGALYWRLDLDTESPSYENPSEEYLQDDSRDWLDPFQHNPTLEELLPYLLVMGEYETKGGIIIKGAIEANGILGGALDAVEGKLQVEFPIADNSIYFGVSGSIYYMSESETPLDIWHGGEHIPVSIEEPLKVDLEAYFRIRLF